MKKLILIYLVFLLAAFVFYGCHQDEEIMPLTEINCNTLVKSKISNNQVVYTVVKQIFAFAPIKEAYEYGPEGTIDLSGNVVTQKTYSFIETETEYFNSEPPEGTYTFKLTFTDGREKTVLSDISKPYLNPVNISGVSMGDGIINVRWDIVENADYYLIGLKDASKSMKIYPENDKSYEAGLDLTDFGFTSELEFINVCIQIIAVRVKSDPEKVSSESIAQIDFHIDEFKPWWMY